MDTKNLHINYPCKFHLGDEPDAWQAWYKDEDWDEVLLPHDWSVHMPFLRENSSGTGYLSGGIGWYRIHISPKPEWAGKQISVTFDGVYKNSRVWCNSYYLGERPNGYISFTYDLTDFFRYDSENIICVYVDRREIADSRWFTGSGILGKVSLNIEEPLHPDTYGIFFSTPKVDDEKAIWKIKAKWVNRSEEDLKATALYELLDKEGAVVSSTKTPMEIPANGEATYETEAELKKPELWSPLNPYLYTLRALAIVNNEKYVVYTEKVGIRTFFFDPDKGFFLNGKSEVFKGVCLHHDAGVLGGAVPPAVWYMRLKKLKDMGCNAIRMSHNPHVPELYSLCDSLGFMVMDEAFDEWEGPKNKWSTGHNVYPPKHQGYYVNFNTWGKKDLTDMILRDRNHPSVIMWSTGNEIDYPNDPYCNESFATATGNNDANKPAEERMYNPLRPDANRLKKLAAMLTKVAKEADDTHPVTLAASFPELSCKVGFIDSLDVVGFNYREYLYEEHHRTYPGKSFLGSENGQGYKEWRVVTDNDYISGQFLWTGIDYLGEAKGWPVHGSYAGLMTLAGIEKTGFYRRRSFWNEEPMVHLATIKSSESLVTAWGQKFDSALECEFSDAKETWNYAEGDKIVVKCYTNLPKVKLLINDREIGAYERAENADCILAEVVFEKGVIRAVACDKDGIVKAEDALYTTGEAVRAEIKATMASNDELPLLLPMNEECSDAFRNLVGFDIVLKDENGNRVYDDDRELEVIIKGGTLLGLENGDLADVTPYTLNKRSTYRGCLVAYVIYDGEGEKLSICINKGL